MNYPGDADAAADDPGLYQGLLDVASHPVRVQKLGNLLHWDRNRPAESGQALALADCLRSVPPQNQLAAIRAFWQLRQAAARLQALGEEQEQLDALRSIAIPRHAEPGMAEAGVRLQAARWATQADLLDAEVSLLAAQIARWRPPANRKPGCGPARRRKPAGTPSGNSPAAHRPEQSGPNTWPWSTTSCSTAPTP